jgi:hypothetical protein
MIRRFFTLAPYIAALAIVSFPSSASSVGFTAYSSWNTSFYSADVDSGIATLIPSTPSSYHLDFAPNGALYGVSRSADAIYRINPNTGAATMLAATAAPSFGSSFSVSPDGAKIVYTTSDIPLTKYSFYEFDLSTFSTMFLGDMPTSEIFGLSDIEFASDGTLYAINGLSTSIPVTHQLYTIDLLSLTATAIGPEELGIAGGFGTSGGIDFAPNGTLYATIKLDATGPPFSPETVFWEIDPLTGIAAMTSGATISTSGGTLLQADGFAIQVVPLPAVQLLFLSALLSLVGLRRKVT